GPLRIFQRCDLRELRVAGLLRLLAGGLELLRGPVGAERSGIDDAALPSAGTAPAGVVRASGEDQGGGEGGSVHGRLLTSRGARYFAAIADCGSGQQDRSAMRVFHCDRYLVPLPAGHRFPIGKYRILREILQRDALVRPAELREA